MHIVLADTPLWLTLVTSLGPGVVGGFVGAVLSIPVQRSAHKRTTIATKREALYTSYQTLRRLTATYEYGMLDFIFELAFAQNRGEMTNVYKNSLMTVHKVLIEAQEAIAAYVYVDTDTEMALYRTVLELHTAYLSWKLAKINQHMHGLEPTSFKNEPPTEEDIEKAWEKIHDSKNTLLTLARAWEKKLS